MNDKIKLEEIINKIDKIIMESGSSPVLFKEIFDAIGEWNKKNSHFLEILLPAYGKRDLGAVHLHYILLNIKSAMSGIQGMLTIEMQHEDHHKGYNLILTFIEKNINFWSNPEEGEREFTGMTKSRDVKKIIPGIIEHIKWYHALLDGLQEVVIKIKTFEEGKNNNNS